MKTKHFYTLDDDEARAHARFYLKLPQTSMHSNNKNTQPETWDYQADECMEKNSGHHAKTTYHLDLWGKHASWCPSAVGHRNARHEMLKHVIAHYARLAGMRVQYEPNTTVLLRGRNAWNVFARACAEQNIDASNLRLDLILSDPPRSLEWEIDVTVICSTADMHCNDKHDLSNIKRTLNPPYKLVPSMAVANAETAKIKKYAILLKAQQKEFSNGARSILPTFIAAAASHAGDVGAGIQKVVEVITRAYKLNTTITINNRLDGKDLKLLSSDTT